ncbi:MAG: 2'-5' RNA ligase family protein [Actinomycetota bacterium]|nr:2'-5' RNA ligase family protein [Actinomycetota bacterium]
MTASRRPAASASGRERKGSLAGVCSVLPEEAGARVLELWAELEREAGLRSTTISPLPHFSYQVARDYDLGVLQEVVAKVAGGARALRVQTAGLGVFTGPSPVLYVPIVRSPELARFQVAVWSACSVAAEKIDQHYHPASWIPHVSLAFGDTTPETTARAVELLSERDLSWDLELDNLSIVKGAGSKPQELVARYPLEGVARNF